ncbi:ubiquitin-related domain-containing protein [Fennellomyces sp. T-0311]|nr:ubiquitin-related domain-containing protein [Fennellomyces sp. T-0311]
MDADKKVDKKEPGASEHINIKVVGGDNNEVFFKIKQTTPLRKLMDAYCERQGKSLDSVRFLYDGHRVLATDTPQRLDMDDGDTIDVMVEQIGGC